MKGRIGTERLWDVRKVMGQIIETEQVGSEGRR